MFKRIVTLALSPSLDTTLWISNWKTAQDHTVMEERTDASGKAVNLARTFKYYDVPSKLIVVLGRYNEHDFLAQLDRECIKYKNIQVDGTTRENLSIVQNDHSVTRLIRKGFAVPYEAVQEVVAELEKCVCPETLVMISGALPEGISPRTLGKICCRIKELGGQVTLDSRSLAMEDIIAIKPWAIKPNQEEFTALVGRPMENLDDIASEARKIVEQGVCHCLVSLGGDGLFCASAQGTYHAHVPDVEVKCTVGAGDNALAGFVKSTMSGAKLRSALKTAAAFGTAACLIDGTQPPPKLSVCNVLSQVTVEQLDD